MMKPEVVVFDLGKVLLDFDYSIVARKLAVGGKLSAEEVRQFINQSPLLFQYETGLITKEQFYNGLASATGFKGSLEEFSPIFADIFEPIAPMVELQATLRQRGIPTYIFSNTNELAIEHIRRSYPFFGGFDGYILSYEHGAMKPHTKLYEVVERDTKRQREKILYLDDRAENVEAGAARGWQVILQEQPEKTIRAIKEIGLID